MTPPVAPIRLPIRKPLLPSTVANAQNGMLPRHLLAEVSPGRLMEATLCAPAMRALGRTVQQRYGWQLGTTGDYRPLQQQWDGFGGAYGRYEPCTEAEYVQRRSEDKAARRKNTTKVWPTARRNEVIVLLGPQKYPIPDETYWRLINPRSLNAAVPGTSNHGKGGSRDVAKIVRRFGRNKAIALSAVERAQLAEVILDHGYAWETLNDLPHITWVCGDELPPFLKGGDMAQLVRADNDPAILLLAGTSVEWVRDGHVFEALQTVHGPVIPVNRLAFAMYHGTGPFPTSTLKPTDFASWEAA